MITLRHYSSTVVKLDRTHRYRQSDRDLKPHGFWVTIPGEDDWPTWCRQEQFAEHRLRFEHEVILRPNANIRVISTPEQLDAFTDEFRTKEGEPHWSDAITSSYRVTSGYSEYGYWRKNYLDFTKIKPMYDGLIIAPYLWTRRHEYMWYYGWDVASGCIWNLDAISSVKWLMPEMVELERRIEYYLDVAAEQAINRIKYGVSDPTGGRGRQLYRLDSPFFPPVSETRKDQ